MATIRAEERAAMAAKDAARAMGSEAARRMTAGDPEAADWARSAWSWALLVWQHDNATWARGRQPGR